MDYKTLLTISIETKEENEMLPEVHCTSMFTSTKNFLFFLMDLTSFIGIFRVVWPSTLGLKLE